MFVCLFACNHLAMKVLFLLVLLFAPHADCCWMTSKDKAVDRIEKYVSDANFNAGNSLTQDELETGIQSLRPTIAWLLRTFVDTDDIFKRCDVNGDGFLTFDEIRKAPNCLSSCTKQLAIIKFLKH